MSLRNQLGDFSSIVCFKAVIVGVEDTLGPTGAAVVFIRAGRVRGQKLADDLGLTGKNLPVEQLAAALDNAVGLSGTKLCRISGARTEGQKVIIDTQETVCSAGEPVGSDRVCTFTLGAVWGALEAVTGKRYDGVHSDCVLRGGSSDRFEFTPL